ncbi:MAG: peptidoglycan DD-metalloendopeptidase family protein [Candidatus Pacebacteria bacterium]|jgi:LysM repeat protein|nr:peptidoglycan DD-metalloendopeptidase family protein [Candidatus Paceibacterota bacterium]
MSNGLLLAVVTSGVGAPLATAQASVFSYFWGKSDKSTETAFRSEAQNSQTISFLEGANNFDSKKAMGGGDITVVDDKALIAEVGPSGTMVDIESNNRQANVSLYVVRAGDTIAQVAKMFDLSVNTILWANDLAPKAALREGQTLIILPVDGIQYTVKKGDTIQSIIKRHGGALDDILEINDLTSGAKLAVGDVLILPGARESSSSAPVLTSPVRSSSKLPVYSGYYTHPVPAGHKTQGVHGNNGVDYGAPIGTPVYAAASGVVIVSNFRTLSNPWFSGYGNYIIIEHPNGTKTLYGHLSSVFTPVGARVDKGQMIGEVGNTGKSTGPHLHFEVRGAKNPF